MRVRMRTLFVTDTINAAPGDIIDVPAPMGTQLLKSGYAEVLDAPVVSHVQEEETAVVTDIPETAHVRRPRWRRSS